MYVYEEMYWYVSGNTFEFKFGFQFKFMVGDRVGTRWDWREVLPCAMVADCGYASRLMGGG